MSEGLVFVGAIMGAFGVQGEVKVKSFTSEPEGIFAYGPLLDAEGAVVLTPKSWRRVKDALAVRAPEVKTREAAEALRATRLHVPRALLPDAEEDEFYHVDLIGCRAENPAGEALGVVQAIHNFGAGDVLEIRAPGQPLFYAPFSKDAIPRIDLKARLVIVDAPEAEE